MKSLIELLEQFVTEASLVNGYPSTIEVKLPDMVLHAISQEYHPVPDIKGTEPVALLSQICFSSGTVKLGGF